MARRGLPRLFPRWSVSHPPSGGTPGTVATDGRGAFLMMIQRRIAISLTITMLQTAGAPPAWALRAKGAEANTVLDGLEETLAASDMPPDAPSAMTRRVFLRRAVGAPMAMAALGFTPLPAATPPPPAAPARPGAVIEGPDLSMWLVYWRAAQGDAMWKATPGRWREVRVFGHHFDGGDHLIPADPWVSRTVGAMQGRGPRVLITIVNDVVPGGGQRNLLKDPEVVHRRIATPAARALFIETLLSVAQPVDGLDIDFERLLAADRAAFTAFIRELAEALHRRGKTLSVTVQPKTNDAVQNGAGAIDWRAVGAAADWVTIMAYYEHWETSAPGPAASRRWLARVANFAVSQVAPKKLRIALSMTGFDWPKDAAGNALPGRAIEYPAAVALARQHGGTVNHTPDGAQILYRAAGVDHEIWVEGAESLKGKIAAVQREQGIRAFSLWRADTWAPAALRGLAGLEEAVRAGQDLSGRYQ